MNKKNNIFNIINLLVVGTNIFLAPYIWSSILIVPLIVFVVVGLFSGIIFYYQYVTANNQERIKEIIKFLLILFIFLSSIGTIFLLIQIFYYHTDPYLVVIIESLILIFLIDPIFLCGLLMILAKRIDKNV